MQATLDARDTVKPLISEIDTQYRERFLEPEWQAHGMFPHALLSDVAGR